MTEFWETAFQEKQAMWGIEPTHSALLAKDLFVEKEVKNVLIPGIGYGRNAQIFIENGMSVTGIEISKKAIELAQKHYENDMIIYHGSVTNMPFDNAKYDGIFCYALIHLFSESERQKLITNCYNQLSKNGYMIFTAISQKATIYGKGEQIGKNRYEIHKGAKIYFYDKTAIKAEFGEFGLFEIVKINENQAFYLIKCRK